MTEGRPSPTPLQQAAVEDTARDLFLVAGAGTGKTSVLVDRYCDVVSDPDGPGVEGVLAFTFTERAAGELKRRIRAELLRRSEFDEARRAELRRLARDSEAAWISTIHGFCQRVLASHSLAAGLDPRYTVLDDSEARRVSQEAFDSAFLEFAAAEGDDDRFDMSAAFGVEALGEMVAAAHDELRSQGHERPELPDVAPVDPAEVARRLNQAARRALEATADIENKRCEGYRDQMAAAVAGTDERVPVEGEASEWSFKSKAKEMQIDAVQEFNELCDSLDARLIEAEFAHYYVYIQELLVLYRDHYAALKARRSVLDFEDLQLVARRLLRDNPEIRASYQARFRHLMVDEFQDTNRLQASLIEQLHMDEGERANHLFTVGDELQSIYGFRHADVGVFRSERARTQAIEEAARAQDAPAPAGVRLLTGNFRSGPQVLALVNAIGPRLFGDAYEPLVPMTGTDGARVSTEVLVTETRDWPAETEFLGGLSADEQAQAWRRAEAQALAGRLAELVDREGVDRGEIVVLLRSYTHVDAYETALSLAGLRPYVVGGRGYWSKQQVTDTLALLSLVANPLDDRAVCDVLSSPACGVRPDTLWLLREGAGKGPLWWAVRRLFGAVREDDEPLQEAGGQGQGEVAKESWAERVERCGAEIPADDAEAVRGLHAQVERLREAAPSLSLDALVDRVVTETGYDLALLMRTGGRRRMANVRKLMRLAREFEAGEGRDLRAFLDWAKTQAEGSRREAEATIQAEGHDGVRIMTIHSSKGLEFPVVAVADLGRGMTGGRGGSLRLAPAEGEEDEPMRVGLRLARLGKPGRQIFDFKALADAAAERDREEERRLLHVAMTRAEHRLILSGAMALNALEKEEPSRTEVLMGAVLRALGWSEGLDVAQVSAAAGADGKVPRGKVKVPVHVTRPPRPGEETAEQLALLVHADVDETAGSLPGPLADPEMGPPAPPGSAPPVTHVSYSALSLYERCGYRFYVERVLGLGHQPAATGGAGPDPGDGGEADVEPLPPEETEALEHRYARGTVVHELLEASARAGWAKPSDDIALSLLEREGVVAGHAALSRISELVDGFLGSPLLAELESASALHPELPFAFKLGELIVRGEIDLLAELGGEVVVVDYKSDALGDDDPAGHMGRYEVQRKIYALAALRRYGVPVRVVYAFLDRPLDPVEQRFEPADIERLTAELEGAAAGIHAGRFEVTQEPNLALCFDCPARKRLCTWDETRTLAS